jgi:hypothetical protein
MAINLQKPTDLQMDQLNSLHLAFLYHVMFYMDESGDYVEKHYVGMNTILNHHKLPGYSEITWDDMGQPMIVVPRPDDLIDYHSFLGELNWNDGIIRELMDLYLASIAADPANSFQITLTTLSLL